MSTCVRFWPASGYGTPPDLPASFSECVRIELVLCDQNALCQRFRRIVLQDRNARLRDHISFVDAFGDPMHRAPCLFITGRYGARMRIETRIFRQERWVNIDEPA